MSSSDDEAVLICLRTTEAEFVVPGSTRDVCADCGAAIWVSVASRQLAIEHKAKMICLECGNERAAKEKDVTVEPITEEQWREFRNAIERG